MPQRNINVLLLKWFLITYFVVGGFLAFWGAIQGTGLPGWLFAIEIETFGKASMKLTALLSAFLYWLPILGILGVLQKVAPRELEGLRQEIIAANQPRQRQEQEELQAAPAPPPDTRPIKTWGGIFKLTFILLALTLLGTAVMYYQIRQNEKVEVLQTRMDALPPAGNLPAWERIELTGTIQRDFYAAFRERSFNHVYLPVTSATWTKADPIRAFVHYKAFAESGQRISLPSELETATSEIIIKGTRGSAIPVFGERMLRGQGANLSLNPIIIDWDPNEPRREDFPEKALAPLVIGLFITIIVVGILSITKTGILQPRPKGWPTATGFEGVWREENHAAEPGQSRDLSIYWMNGKLLNAAQVFRQGDFTIRRATGGVQASGNTLQIETLGTFHRVDSGTIRQETEGINWRKISSTPI